MKPIANPEYATPEHRAALNGPATWEPREYFDGKPLYFHATVPHYGNMPKELKKKVRKRLAHLKSEADVVAFNRSRLTVAK